MLAAIVAAFLFWQARVAFASVSLARGALAVAGILAVIWVLLAAAGGFLTASRHARHLTGRSPGPPWLALPIAPRDLARHLRWEARAESRWLLAPAAGLLAASFGLIPPWSIFLFAITFPILSSVADRLGCIAAFRLSLGSAEPRPGLPPLIRLMATAARALPSRSRWRARWHRRPVWRALVAKDLKLGVRTWETRRHLIPPIVFGALSILVWTLPVDAAAARLLAFALALMASATLGDWLVAMSGREPFWILRGLPVGVTSVWGTRALWGALWGTVLAAGHAAAASPLSPPALDLFIGWIGAAALVIVVLAVNYSLTLFPHPAAAQRLFTLSLGVAMAVSLMIPLLGWVALLAALLHSARRLPRWGRSEE